MTQRRSVASSSPNPPATVLADRESGVRLVQPEAIPTWIQVHYPAARGAIGLRGSHAPLSWDHTTPPVRSDGDDHLFQVPLRADELLDLKVVRGEDWALGRNYVVHAGDHLCLEPCFDGGPTFERDLVVEHDGRTAKIDVFLPPSYGEQPAKRYPVLYMLDGQSLWTHSTDPFGTWDVDLTLASLYELGAVEEMIVVGVHTSEERLAVLSPVPDAEHGGGEGPRFLSLLVDGVRPFVDARYRTRREASATGILGSSMGGLFAFYASWTRPDVFGKAACLSSSFWWADRWAVKHVQTTSAPSPRPFFYLDSGAAPGPVDDARLLDGFHHTRSMLRALVQAGLDPGADLHRLVFPGERHHAAAWASRVALPLQMLFPQAPRPLDLDRWDLST